MKKIFAIAGAVALAFSMSACNTMKGAGKDIERGGEKIQGAASNVQNGSTTSSGTSTSGTSK